MPTSNPSELELENEQLRQAYQTTEQNLRENEERLSTLQESVLSLQDEYQKESDELQVQIRELTAVLHKAEEEKAELKRLSDKASKTKKVFIPGLFIVPFISILMKHYVSLTGTGGLSINSSVQGRVRGDAAKAPIESRRKREVVPEGWDPHCKTGQDKEK